jgi:beta-lactamase regulating signal transducer with metallopeptidase domain
MSMMAFVSILVLKPAIVVATAWVLVLVIARRGAAARHALWAGCAVAILLLPLFSAVLPPLRLGIFSPAIPRVLAPLTIAFDAGPSTDDGQVAPHIAETVVGGASGETTTGAPLDFAAALWSVWAGVALLLIARRVSAELSARRLIGRGKLPAAAFAARLSRIARTHGTEHVRTVISDEAACPAVAGLVRPAIILPANAEQWTDAQASAILAHELAHVARRDCLLNLLGDLAAAIYWCNPLAHYAARRIRAEAERACDDAVVHESADADSYALMLLDFTRAAQGVRPLPRAATAMARPSELESRVIALLHSRTVRAPLGRSLTWVFASVAVVIALPVAAATVVAAELEKQLQPELQPQPQRKLRPVASIVAHEPGQGSDSLGPRSERVPLQVDEAQLRSASARALAGPDSVMAARLIEALSHVPKHDGDLIRDRAAWALLQTRGNRLIEPLIDSLASADWRVQTYAAWIMAIAQERRAVPQLLELVRHPVWRVRAMAAFALCWIPDRRAPGIMIAALKDPAWQVRMEAVEYLGSMPQNPYDDMIRTSLADQHVAVRRAAADVLGMK